MLATEDAQHTNAVKMFIVSTVVHVVALQHCSGYCRRSVQERQLFSISVGFHLFLCYFLVSIVIKWNYNYLCVTSEPMTFQAHVAYITLH